FHHRMISPNVENAVAAQKVQIWLIIHIIEVSAFRSRIDLVEPDYSLRLHQSRVYVSFVKLVIFTQSRCDNFLQIKGHSVTFCDLRSKRKLRLPVAVNGLCTHLQIRLGHAVAFELFHQPLEPLPTFLRAGTRTLQLDKRAKILPRDPGCSTD